MNTQPSQHEAPTVTFVKGQHLGSFSLSVFISIFFTLWLKHTQRVAGEAAIGVKNTVGKGEQREVNFVFVFVFILYTFTLKLNYEC